MRTIGLGEPPRTALLAAIAASGIDVADLAVTHMDVAEFVLQAPEPFIDPTLPAGGGYVQCELPAGGIVMRPARWGRSKYYREKA